jgi:phosphate transport system permease protein
MSAISPAATSDAVRQGLIRRGSDVRGTIFLLLLLGSLLFSLVILAVLVWDSLTQAIPVFEARGASFFANTLSSDPNQAGIIQGLIGTFVLTILVAIFAFPIGIATAIYLEEYAPTSRVTRFIQLNIRNLAGVPSVVYGLLGLTVFVAVVDMIDGDGNGRSMLSGGLTLGVLVLPIVIITSMEALRAVPITLREAGYGVGASRWEVTRKLTIPAAVPGILTGTVLALSRAIGESAPIIIAGAVLGSFSTVSASLTAPYTALPVIIYDWSRRPQDAFRADAAAAIIVLLAITVFANGIAIYLRNRFERTW